jgi:hypothetical protein
MESGWTGLEVTTQYQKVLHRLLQNESISPSIITAAYVRWQWRYTRGKRSHVRISATARATCAGFFLGLIYLFWSRMLWYRVVYPMTKIETCSLGFVVQLGNRCLKTLTNWYYPMTKIETCSLGFAVRLGNRCLKTLPTGTIIPFFLVVTVWLNTDKKFWYI